MFMRSLGIQVPERDGIYIRGLPPFLVVAVALPAPGVSSRISLNGGRKQHAASEECVS